MKILAVVLLVLISGYTGSQLVASPFPFVICMGGLVVLTAIVSKITR